MDSDLVPRLEREPAFTKGWVVLATIPVRSGSGSVMSELPLLLATLVSLMSLSRSEVDLVWLVNMFTLETMGEGVPLLLENSLPSSLNLARLSVLDFLTGPPEAGDIFLVGGGL